MSFQPVLSPGSGTGACPVPLPVLRDSRIIEKAAIRNAWVNLFVTHHHFLVDAPVDVPRPYIFQAAQAQNIQQFHQCLDRGAVVISHPHTLVGDIQLFVARRVLRGDACRALVGIAAT